jgi:hypothetical protein
MAFSGKSQFFTQNIQREMLTQQSWPKNVKQKILKPDFAHPKSSFYKKNKLTQGYTA